MRLYNNDYIFMKKFRIYTDTSVIGGYFDKEFELYSKSYSKCSSKAI